MKRAKRSPRKVKGRSFMDAVMEEVSGVAAPLRQLMLLGMTPPGREPVFGGDVSREHRLRNALFGDTPLAVWLCFYESRDHWRGELFSALQRLFGWDDGTREEVETLFRILPDLHALSAEWAESWNVGSPEEREAAVEEARANTPPTLDAFLRRCGIDLGAEADKKPAKTVEIALREPAVRFTLRVVLPCLADTGKTPWALVENAAKDDENALRALLAMDKNALFLPGVQALYARRAATDAARFRQTFPEYLRATPKPPSRAKLKHALTALVREMSRDFSASLDGMPFTGKKKAELRQANTAKLPDMQALFTRHAQTAGEIRAPRRDPDTEDADAFRQGVHRARKTLPKPPWRPPET